MTEGACVALGLDKSYCIALSLSRLRRQLPPGGSLKTRATLGVWALPCVKAKLAIKEGLSPIQQEKGDIMKKNEREITYPSKPKIKEIVMFVFSCVVLISTLIFLLLPTGIEMGNGTNSNVDQTIPGEEVIAIMAGLHALVVIGVILCVALIICWIVGFIVSTKLVLRKKIIARCKMKLQ